MKIIQRQKVAATCIPFWMGNVMHIVDKETTPPSTFTVTTAFDTFSRNLLYSRTTVKDADVHARRGTDICLWATNACTKVDKPDAWMFSSLLRLLGLLGWFKSPDGGTRIRWVLQHMELVCVMPTEGFIRVLLKCLHSLPKDTQNLILIDDAVAFMRSNHIVKDQYMQSMLTSINSQQQRLPVFRKITDS